MEIPSEMLYRNGIAMIAINAGMASVRSLKSILVTDVSIRNPTMIRAGAVAKDGIARKIGDNSSDNPKRMAATREVSPVRPPSATPEALSTKVVTVEVPHIALSDNMELSKQLGTRHRAGVGISEQTDSVTIIVSEETGQVSVAQGGKLTRGVNSAKLREILVRAQNKQVVDNSKLRHLLKGRVKHEEAKNNR